MGIRIVLLTLLFNYTHMYCSPIQFARVIIPQGNTPFKTIDIIFDLHSPTLYESSSTDASPEALLSDTEKKLFLPQERAFINSLYELNQLTDHKITVLWECNPLEDEKTIAKINTENKCTYNLDNNNKLLVYYGYHFDKKPIGTNITFIPSDTWRPDSILYEILIRNNRLHLKYSYTVQEAFHFITQHFENNNIADQLLEKVKTHNPVYYAQIHTIYSDFKQTILNNVYTTLELSSVKKNKPLKKFLEKIKKKKTLNQSLKNILHVPGLMDMELLCNIFSTNESHYILYAGASHCDYLIELLLYHFDGQLVTSVGIDFDLDFFSQPHLLEHRETLVIPLPQLKKGVWQLMKEPPQLSWQRYTTQGILKSLINPGIIPIIDSLKEKKSWDPTWQTLLSYAQRGYIDIANAVDDTRQSLLHVAALTRNPHLVKLLLETGASVKAQNLSGKTALSYAAAQKDSEIAQLLLEAGADPFCPDEMGISPLLYAQYTGDVTLNCLFSKYLSPKEAYSPKK